MTIKFKELPSQEYLLALFDHDGETGELFHKKNRPLDHFKNAHGSNIWHAQHAGKRAGSLNKHDGYWYVWVTPDNRVLQHRVIWKMAYGVEPKEEIDHKDRDRSNNRLDNLRESDRSGNCHNVSAQAKNTTGHRNVQWNKRRECWEVVIGCYKKTFTFGGFPTLEEAATAAEEIRLALHGEFAQDARTLCPDKDNLPDLAKVLEKYRSRPRGDNKSGVSGVNWCKRKEKWWARRSHNGKRLHVGYFDTLEAAAKVLEDYKKNL
jgi:hypothetical protein